MLIRKTYFERYKDARDIMDTVEGKNIKDIDIAKEISALNNVLDCTIYQKAISYTWITEDMFSDKLKELGGLTAVAGSNVAVEDGRYMVKVPVIILDDSSFESYYKKVRITDSSLSENKMVTINRIWNNIHSEFRYKEYVPFIEEKEEVSLTLFQAEDESDRVDSPILAYTNKLPILREEYASYALVQVMSASTWQSKFSNMSEEKNETYINIQTMSDDNIQSVQSEVEQLLNGYTYEIENRVEEKELNKEIQKGYTLIMAGLCGLLAIIGLANVFSDTLGSIYQRKREFARYLSIGLTPKGIKKMLCMEALIIGGKPILITVPLTIVFVIFAANASYLNPMEFVEYMSVTPLLIFALLILGCVALAYYIGGRKIYRSNIVEVLKDDTFS